MCTSSELQRPQCPFLEKDTDQFILLAGVFVCVTLPCRYLASWEKVEQSGFGTASVCFCKTQETRRRPAPACDGRRADLRSEQEWEWEVKNEEQNKSMSAPERELTTVQGSPPFYFSFQASRHISLCLSWFTSLF